VSVNATPLEEDDPLEPDAPETGAFLYTFTFRLPFVLGISDNFDQTIEFRTGYANREDSLLFQGHPFVRLRLFNAPTADRKFWPANMGPAIKCFYGIDIGSGDEGDGRYEQWITLETPAAFLWGEEQTDGAYAFHRSLTALSLFLQAFALARDDDRVRPISSRELRPIVMVGSLGLDGNWACTGPMLMHPDAKPRVLSRWSVAEHVGKLNAALDAILDGKPLIRARQWRARAERRRYEGDNANAIVSFQIAAETLAYELWALLLTDEGTPPAEVAAALRASELTFKSLLNRELALRLGGSWDLTRRRGAVGRYWHDLYELRNRVVHAGYLPHDGDAEQAERAFSDFDKFLEHRLTASAKKYPGALYAKTGEAPR
jgi:Apea-like HEPN